MCIDFGVSAMVFEESVGQLKKVCCNLSLQSQTSDNPLNLGATLQYFFLTCHTELKPYIFCVGSD